MSTPPQRNTVLFSRLFDFFCRWHIYAKKFPKSDRYTIAHKVSDSLLELLTVIMRAQYLSREQARFQLIQVSPRLDEVKILIRLSARLRIIPEKTYLDLEEELDEVGRMLGGWIRSI